MKGFFKFVLFFVVAVMLWQWFFTPDVNMVYITDDMHSGHGFWIDILAPVFIAFIAIGAVCLVFGVLAAVFVGVGVAVLSILFVGISVFWPILLALIIFYWLFSDPKQDVS